MRAILVVASLAASCAPVAVSSAPSSRNETRTLRLTSREVDVDPARKRVVFRPGGGVKRARYTHYLFDHDELMRFTGGARDITLRVAVLGMGFRVRKSPPDAPAPEGGVGIEEIVCRILERLDRPTAP